MPNSNRMNWPFPSENSAPWYDAFEDMITALDASGYAAREDRNIVLAGGGTLSWTLGTSTFTWTADLQIMSTITGHVLTIAPDSLTLDDGEIAYVNLVRSPTGSSARTPQIASQVPGSDNAFLIVLRIGDDIYFRNGQRLKDGETFTGIGSGPGGGGGGGSGDVVGPEIATDNAAALYNSTTGKLIKNSTLLYTTGELRINDATNPTLATKERASSPSPAASFGYHWVKNDTPNVPMFTDDDGNANQLAYTTTYTSTGGNLRRYRYDSSTVAPPGNNYIRLNTTSVNTATEMYISDINGDGMSMENVLIGIAPGDHIRLVRRENILQSVLLYVSAVTDNAGYFTLTLDNTKVKQGGTSWVFPDSAQQMDVWLLKAGKNLSGAGVPGVSTGNGYPLGTTYADTTNDVGYILVDNTTGSNVWWTGGAGGGGQVVVLASNALVQLDQTEIVIGGGYIDGSTGGTYTWEALATQIDGGGGVAIGTSSIRLYDMGADGSPTAGTLRSTLEFPTDDTLDRVSLTLTASGTPGTDTDTIQNAARMYEVRAYLDSTGGNVDSFSILNVKFVES